MPYACVHACSTRLYLPRFAIKAKKKKKKNAQYKSVYVHLMYSAGIYWACRFTSRGLCSLISGVPVRHHKINISCSNPYTESYVNRRDHNTCIANPYTESYVNRRDHNTCIANPYTESYVNRRDHNTCIAGNEVCPYWAMTYNVLQLIILSSTCRTLLLFLVSLCLDCMV